MTKPTKTAEVEVAATAPVQESAQANTAVANTADAEGGDEPDPASPEGEPQGIRARKVLQMKQFLPNPDWINQNIVAGGKGTRATIGRVYGIATSTEEKTNTLPNGDVVASIAVKGSFQAESYLDGELTQATTVYFPMAYAEKIEQAFKALGALNVEVDCDVGLEATGKTIPYEWVIVAFREGQEMDALKRMRSNRKRPASVLVAADGSPKALAGAPANQALIEG